MLQFDELVLLDAEEIKYAELSDEVLRKLVMDQPDQFMATNALCELARQMKAVPIANDVLRTNSGDNHLRCYAFSILSRHDRESALQGIRSLLPTADKKLLMEIVETLCDEMAQLQALDEDRLSIVREVVTSIARWPVQEFGDPPMIESFLRAAERSVSK